MRGFYLKFFFDLRYHFNTVPSPFDRNTSKLGWLVSFGILVSKSSILAVKTYLIGHNAEHRS